MPDQNHNAFTADSLFLTLRLARHGDDLLIRHIDALRNAMRRVLRNYPMEIDAIVVLPAVIHTLWTLPQGDKKGPNRIRMLKSRFSRAVPFPDYRTPEQIKRGDKGIWQGSYWAFPVRDRSTFDRHRDLIHLSPVRAGLCTRPQDWPHSSIHRDIARGLATPRLATPVPTDKAGARHTDLILQ
ncbi:MAG: transposase [Sulfitobacter sp.]|nr:transposase [Sulfitobacter sp.]